MSLSTFIKPQILNELLSKALHYPPYYYSFNYKTSRFQVGPLNGGKIWNWFNIWDASTHLTLYPVALGYVLIGKLIFGIGGKEAVQSVPISIIFIYTLAASYLFFVISWNYVYRWAYPEAIAFFNQLIVLHEQIVSQERKRNRLKVLRRRGQRGGAPPSKIYTLTSMTKELLNGKPY